MSVQQKRVLCGIVALIATVWLAIPAVADEALRSTSKPPKSQPRLGMNLSGPADWNSELPFVDVFRLSRPWVSQKKGERWGAGPSLSLDQRGWVKRLDADCWAETPLCTIQDGHYPSGAYTVLYEGHGKLDFWGGAAKVLSRQPGRAVVEIDSAQGGFFLRLTATNPDNYVRNIRVIMPGFEKTYRDQPFHPVFLKHWQGVAGLRFMDWMHTNGSKIGRWSERPTPDDATFSAKGVALEVMLDLANRLQADPWFCMPHLADDHYVRQFASLVKARLDSERKVYVEYSNEVWNGQFPQSKFAGAEGIRLGFAEKPWEASWRYTAYRSVQIFQIWEDVFGNEKRRLVRVLPSQAANAYVSERVVGFQDAFRHADALAIAPYVTCNVTAKGKPRAEEVEKWTLDDAFDHLEKRSLPESIRWIQQQKRVADQFGLKLVAYEGGQHMVGVGGVTNHAAITRLFQAANRDPRMGEIYRKYYDAWTAEGGDLFCYFASTGVWSKWGSWGILQWFDDDPARSPKFMATMRWAQRCGQPVYVPE